MKKTKIFFISVFLFFFSIISLPLYVWELIVGLRDEKRKVRNAQIIVSQAFRIILFLAGARIDCSGTENVPKDHPILYVANHRSYFDILAGYTTVPTLTGFVSKKEMQNFPCVNHWMRILKCLFLDRKDTKEGLKTILKGIEQMKDGYSIFIMPEGTRSHDENYKMLPFHAGSFKLATKSNAVVVPVAIKNSDLVLRTRYKLFHPVRIQIQYGEPIYVENLSKEEQKNLHAITQNIVQEMLAKM